MLEMQSMSTYNVNLIIRRCVEGYASTEERPSSLFDAARVARICVRAIFVL